MNTETTAEVLNRVPHIILLYWVIKIASTTLGETGADMFSMTNDPGYGATILLFLDLFVIFLGVKLAMRRYNPVTTGWCLPQLQLPGRLFQILFTGHRGWDMPQAQHY